MFIMFAHYFHQKSVNYALGLFATLELNKFVPNNSVRRWSFGTIFFNYNAKFASNLKKMF